MDKNGVFEYQERHKKKLDQAVENRLDVDYKIFGLDWLYLIPLLYNVNELDLSIQKKFAKNEQPRKSVDGSIKIQDTDQSISDITSESFVRLDSSHQNLDETHTSSFTSNKLSRPRKS